ncbi:iron ABC transporter permease [Paenibacillus sp. SYP-B3998]|uniref:Iron ABC transporter permease n=1 Tax=Paenibacillus sp. SYP-B3998 TaxID=2678564 RepID=A0A6G4A6H2_9BACL|nr:iron ABC transporter permease [Paenibacillus sp. SYP-B3998]NEW09237.1 iron ABC transporter permease [Paenibacillus sp. SYP-B3998]
MSQHIHMKQAASDKVNNLRTRPLAATLIIIGGSIALALSLCVSISLGAADISIRTVWEALFHFNPNVTQHQIIQELRLPRALAGALIGSCFAVAGAILQGMTRNPLADTGLLGINAGAGFVLALCFAFFPGLPFYQLILYSFLGAAVGTGLVYGIGSMAKGGLTPVRLALAGAAVAALLAALSEGIAIFFKVGQELAFWYAGGVAGTKWLQIKIMFPWIIGGLIGSLLLSRSITLLSLGEEIATNLGQRTKLVKLGCVIVVLILAGAAVSSVGSIGFVGLMVPHAARALVGVDYRWIIPCSAVLGSLLMVLADIGARLVHPPFETPVGALIAVIGVPFFLYLTRRDRREL